MRKVALMILAMAAVVAGCNTVAGAGQDLSAGGQAISNAAQQAK
jgi:predicted small secreted protein